ncbi:MAG: PorP/SprF family type IX secretion system membrane protein [Bacteroidota bacterium]
MRKTIFSLFILIVICQEIFAQQLPVLDNYLINPVSISSAFSGKYYSFQTMVTHRSEGTRIIGSPVIGNINIDAAIAKKMGIGGSILLNKSGIYKHLSVNLNYAYHLQLAKLHFLSFGLSATMYQNSMDVSAVIVKDPNDPMLVNPKITESYFNVGTSLLYTGSLLNYQDFNFSVSFPILFNNRSFYADTLYEYVLAMNRNLLIYSNYSLELNEDWKLKFDLLFRYTQQTPWTIEVSTLAKFQDSYWFGLLYRKPSIIGVTAGLAIINSIVINYNYEFLGFSMLGNSGGSHEVTLGYRFGGIVKPKKTLQIKDYAK